MNLPQGKCTNIQADRKVLANQPDITVTDKEQKEVVVKNIAVLSESNIKKKGV